MNTSYKKTLLLALSLLTGSTIINAMPKNVQLKIDQNESAANWAKNIQRDLVIERSKLFKGADSNIFISRQGSTPQWISITDRIKVFVKQHFPTNKLLNNTANTCFSTALNISNILAMQAGLFQSSNVKIKQGDLATFFYTV